jgi:hypothetical protein
MSECTGNNISRQYRQAIMTDGCPDLDLTGIVPRCRDGFLHISPTEARPNTHDGIGGDFELARSFFPYGEPAPGHYIGSALGRLAAQIEPIAEIGSKP